MPGLLSSLELLARRPRRARFVVGLSASIVVLLADAPHALAQSHDRAAEGRPTVVVFGAAGDLFTRLLMPAFVEGRTHGLMQGARVLGVDRGSEAQFRETLATRRAENPQHAADPGWTRLESELQYAQGDVTKTETFGQLRQQIAQLEATEGGAGPHVFYLALPPDLAAKVVEGLHQEHLLDEGPGVPPVRVVVEKPFGVDRRTARRLNRLLARRVGPRRVFAMDHYLGKDAVQDLLSLRISGRLASLWRDGHVQGIEARAIERLGVGARAGYFDPPAERGPGGGVTRDMVQSHLFQLTAIAAMDTPAQDSTEAVHAVKLQAMRSLPSMARRKALRRVVRGQYRGYREEAKRPGSSKETYVRIPTQIASGGRRDVAVLIESGKSLAEKRTEVRVKFDTLTPDVAREFNLPENEPAELVVTVDPTSQIELRAGGRSVPIVGDDKALRVPAYTRQIDAVIRGDHRDFPSAPEIEQGWRFIGPMLRAWERQGARGLASYEPGGAAPEATPDAAPRVADHLAQWRRTAVRATQKSRAATQRWLRNARTNANRRLRLRLRAVPRFGAHAASSARRDASPNVAHAIWPRTPGRALTPLHH